MDSVGYRAEIKSSDNSLGVQIKGTGLLERDQDVKPIFRKASSFF